MDNKQIDAVSALADIADVVVNAESKHLIETAVAQRHLTMYLDTVDNIIRSWKIPSETSAEG